MANEKHIELSWLIPDFSKFTLHPQTGTELSTLFVALLIAVTVVFTGFFLYKCIKTGFRLSWLSNKLEPLKREDVASKREELYQQAKQKDKGIGFLWLEFDETLVEIQKGEHVELRNTLDAGHFFNSYTLARSVTENRLIAAVPGFLTALGVIGTFMGLQLVLPT